MREWPEHVERMVTLALEEDIGKGDITTDAIYSGNETGSAVLVAKENGVLAGLDLIAFIIGKLDKDITFHTGRNDGDIVAGGSVIATLEGRMAPMLSAERTILNFFQRMCGIATRTRKYVRALSSTKTKILDTRKTAPGHRYLDKLAVLAGGGENHRIRLDDRFLIKENHIRMAGSIAAAVSRCRAYRSKHNTEAALEIEITSIAELDELLAAEPVEYVMLDNMPLQEMQDAVKRIDGMILTEVSGNVTLERVPEIAGAGVDFISSGELTHSVRAMDISMLIRERSGG